MSALLAVVLDGRPVETLGEAEAERLMGDLLDAARTVAYRLVAARRERWRRTVYRSVVRRPAARSVRAVQAKRRGRRRISRRLPSWIR